MKHFSICLIAVALLPLAAQAHKVSTAYLTLTGDTQNSALFHGVWDIALLDLDFALHLDADGNGEVTWGELRAKHKAIAKYALTHLAIRADDQTCRLQAGKQQVDSHSDGAYSVLHFDAVCPSRAPRTLEVNYRLFFGIDPSHRGIITLRDGDETASAVSAPSDPSINSPSIRMKLPRSNAGLLARVRGIEPIIGLCLLFAVVALLALLRRRQRLRRSKSPPRPK